MKIYKKINAKLYWEYEIVGADASHIDDIKTILEAHLDKIIIPKDHKCFMVEKRNGIKTAEEVQTLDILKKCGIAEMERVIKRIVYFIGLDEDENAIFEKNHDKMVDAGVLCFAFGSTSSPARPHHIEARHIDEVDGEREIDIDKVNEEYGLALSDIDLQYIKKHIGEWKSPMFMIFDIAQSNSEHCRHHFFNGNCYIDGVKQEKTLFELVKEPIAICKADNSRIAFHDNSSAIEGHEQVVLKRNMNNEYGRYQKLVHYVCTAETHNFPTGISPFPGSATGVGGRIRDVQSTGRGAITVCGSAGYCVGNIKGDREIYPHAHPMDILIEASNGASDYGNKFGEPIVMGFANSFVRSVSDHRMAGKKATLWEYVKPIMFTSGHGLIYDNHLEKMKPTDDMLICKVGGPVYKIGFGGSSASSRAEGNNFDYFAVQRDDPEMEQKMDKVIKKCVELDEKNPICSIHDQGAGGNGNVLKEIIEGKGATIDIGNLTLGEKGLSNIEIWNSEYQESNACLVREQDINDFQEICHRENVNLDIVGKIMENNELTIINGEDIIVDNYDRDMKVERNNYYFTRSEFGEMERNEKMKEYLNMSLIKGIRHVFSTIVVGSKRYLTNKVDRCVGGHIVQQQCIGPLHIPLSDYACYVGAIGSDKGCAMAIGSQPIFGLADIDSMVCKTVGECLFNLCFICIESIERIKCSANWMWPCPNKDPEEGYKMYMAMKRLNTMCKNIGISIDGGKDSLSMKSKLRGEDKTFKEVKSPGTLVLTAYVDVPNIYNRVTADCKEAGNVLVYIDLGHGRMGGSVFCRDEIMEECPWSGERDIINVFKLVQQMIRDKVVVSGHDISEGGLITALCEMAFAGNKGLIVTVPENVSNNGQLNQMMFNEELGLVIECSPEHEEDIIGLFKFCEISAKRVAKIVSDNYIRVLSPTKMFLNKKMTQLREIWENVSRQCEYKQMMKECVNEEYLLYTKFEGPRYEAADWLLDVSGFDPLARLYKVAILREEGVNSERECAAAFYYAGFVVNDVTMTDLMSGRVDLTEYRGICFCGGFSYSDVLGSARGWSEIIKKNDGLKNMFEKFYKRNDTFSIGICNGCQLMCNLGWVRGKCIKNISGKFESRFSQVRVMKSNNIFLQRMEGLSFGIWVAHGEGRFQVKDERLSCMRYVDYEGKPTTYYPLNPNGSDFGTGAVSSPCGRHLAIMPHPERSCFKYQIPWSNLNMKGKYSPWFQMFRNAYNWCERV
jgi:phosphoribosylformylglycinamidine synthase